MSSFMEHLLRRSLILRREMSEDFGKPLGDFSSLEDWYEEFGREDPVENSLRGREDPVENSLRRREDPVESSLRGREDPVESSLRGREEPVESSFRGRDVKGT